MRNPQKGYSALRKGRSSQAGAAYFLTVCLAKGDKGLDSARVFPACQSVLARIEIESASRCHGFVLMPDHIHLLIELNETESSLPAVIRLFKGRMSPTLRRLGMSWQRGYFDRRLREDDSIGVVLRYMLINPYRKRLVDLGDEWPFWKCSDIARVWLDDEDGRDQPMPEWLKK